MATYRTTIESTKSVQDAFAFMADFTNAADWDPGVKAAKRGEQGAIGLGSTFVLDVLVGGRPKPYTYRVEEFDAPKLVVFKAIRGSITSLDTITVEPRGTGSAVTYNAVLTLSGPAALASPLLSLAFKRIGDRATAGLRAALA